jgi:hypothetical protein
MDRHVCLLGECAEHYPKGRKRRTKGACGPYTRLPRKAIPMDPRCDEAWFYCNKGSLDLYVGLPGANAIVVRIRLSSLPKEWRLKP